MTPSVRSAQEANGSAELYDRSGSAASNDRLGGAEASFIADRDSFYIASISESGWPYVQHRGGPPGFLKTIDDKTLAFADFRGNRQYLTLGNVAADNRVALILVDYPRRRRLKLLARVEVRDLASDPELGAALRQPEYRATAERVFVLHVEAFDWNCPQHITPRFTQSEIVAASVPLHARLAELEAENAVLRKQRAQKEPRS